MMPGIFIAGTDTGVGKSRVTRGLLRALQQRGVRACGMKPVATGTSRIGGVIDNEDVAACVALAPADTPRQLINPYCFEPAISPHAASRRAATPIEPERVVAAYRALAARSDAVVVEGTGGWYAPIGERSTMADIATQLALPVVLTVGLRLGCLNHALLSLQAIRLSGLPLAGWIGSVLEAQMPALEDNIAFLSALPGVPRLALLPFSTAEDADAEYLGAAASALFATGTD
jgi:dethiobiotin synthetase